LLSFPQGTEMFQFPWFPLPALCVQTGVTPHDGCRVSPFGHPRINARSTASRGFSQSPTSFIGSRRQGIHRWLFVAWKNKFFNGDRLGGSLQRCSCSLCNSQGATKEHRCSGGQRPATLSVAPSKRKRGRRTRARAGDRRTESRPSSTTRDGPPVHQLGVPHRSPAEIGRRRGGTP
jgi:hypothetical protein